jgi:hypothetical protein
VKAAETREQRWPEWPKCEHGLCNQLATTVSWLRPRTIPLAFFCEQHSNASDDPLVVPGPRRIGYNESPSGVECIDVVEHMTFNVGNAVKYCWRSGHKGALIEDLKKARWYLDREISRLEKAQRNEERGRT